MIETILDDITRNCISKKGNRDQSQKVYKQVRDQRNGVQVF